MSDLKDPRWMYIKAILFVCIGGLASFLLIAPDPTWDRIVLLFLAIWGFARAYYFAFYVIQNYIDPDYRFAGLFDFLKYLWKRRRNK